jgi:hypothetical protein
VIIREGLQRKIRAYSGSPKAACFSSDAANRQLAIYSVAAINKSGGSCDVAIGKLLNNLSWNIFRDQASTVAQQDSSIKAGTAVGFFANDNDSLYAGANDQFGVLGLTIAQANTGSPVYTYTYYNGATWATLTCVASVTDYTTGDKFIIFLPPSDWVKSSNVTGLSTDKYYIRIKSTTKSNQAVNVSAAWVITFLGYRYALANNSAFQLDCPDHTKPMTFGVGEGLVPYFGTTNAANCMEVSYNNME